MTKKEKHVIQTLFDWYGEHARSLPWRYTQDPYEVLVSEIMLQQTQVTRVIEKWTEFLDYFPTMNALAEASPAAVITAWQGLGYNRRALYLQKAATEIITKYNGEFPKDNETLQSLPGIGDYTARAVQSFAFDQPVAMMDTNHREWYIRFFAQKRISDKELAVIAQQVVDHIAPETVHFIPKNIAYGKDCSFVWHWNQAIMDAMTALPSIERNRSTLLYGVSQKYPSRPKKKKKKNITKIPFKQTNRYIRGRIIDTLREEKKVSKRAIIAQFSEFSKERIVQNIQNLSDEGLIQIEKQSIILPTTLL